MITYEYRCPACGHEEEVRHSIRERPVLPCSACGAAELVRMISGGGEAFLATGGKSAAPLQSKVDSKHREDMAHAKKVAAGIKAQLQPKTQSGPLSKG